MRKYILILSVIALIASCKKNPNREVIDKWENRKDKKVKEYTNKQANDYYLIEYYDNGNIKSKGMFKAGLQDGKTQYFDDEGYLSKEVTHKNGVIQSEYNFKYGRLTGTEKLYHPNGKLWTERMISESKPWEVISNFDSTGKPMDPGTLKDGNGTIKLYDNNGNLREIKTYKDGQEVVDDKDKNTTKTP